MTVAKVSRIAAIFVKPITLKYLDQEIAARFPRSGQIAAPTRTDRCCAPDPSLHYRRYWKAISQITRSTCRSPSKEVYWFNTDSSRKIPFAGTRPRNKRHFQNIQREHPTGITHQFCRYLRPATRCSAQIGDPHTGFDQMIFSPISAACTQRAHGSRPSAPCERSDHLHVLQPGVTGLAACHRVESAV